MGKYHLRTVRSSSGATVVQVVWYEKHVTKIAKHIGSAQTEDELAILRTEADRYIVEHEPQRSLFDKTPSSIAAFDQIEVKQVSHRFARDVLLKLANCCRLDFLDILYRDLALMRIIEPCSKRRSLQLLKQYFDISYTHYAYERFSQLLEKQSQIEEAAVATAREFSDTFALLLYDVTTLYFETHKADDDLQARGFSKDDKSKQPQIVIGLLVTAQGFPLIHEVFKGNTFEGHTMLSVVKSFQLRYGTEKPIIVADAAMLSQTNQAVLEAEGYCYIVGARLANTAPSFIQTVHEKLPREDNANLRLSYPKSSYDMICTFSMARYKKEKREMDKQIDKAKLLVAHQEPGKRVKFVKQSKTADKGYLFDETLREKTEKLLGIKGYCTNISENVLANEKIVTHYHELWRVEQAFRMSKTDLKTRPVFHFSHEAIKAHVLVCFIALMVGKYIEIKTGLSLRHVRDLLWQVHEVNLYDPTTKRERIVRTSINSELKNVLNLLNLERTH